MRFPFQRRKVGYSNFISNSIKLGHSEAINRSAAQGNYTQAHRLFL